jgi:hypothetical protein
MASSLPASVLLWYPSLPKIPNYLKKGGYNTLNAISKKKFPEKNFQKISLILTYWNLLFLLSGLK